jgi:hypothetical protein
MSIQCLLLQILTPSRFAKPSSGFTFYLPFLFSPSLAADGKKRANYKKEPKNGTASGRANLSGSTVGLATAVLD